MSKPPQQNRPKGRLKLSLSQKGLILLAAPLAVQLALVCALSHFYSQAEEDARQSEKARQISESINDAIKQSYDIVRAAFHSIESATAGSAPDPLETDELNKSLDRLQALVQNNPSDLAALAQARQSTVAVHKIFDSLLPPEATKAFQKNGQQRRSTYVELRAYAHKMEPLVEIGRHHQEFAAGSPERQAAVRRAANNVVVLGTLLNVTFLLALVWFFHRNIISRLAVLMDNNMRLAAAKPLHPSLAGFDEIAQLDQGFHAMAQALTESMDKQKRAERLRKEVMQMVSHDLRSPLTTILGIIQMFQRNISTDTDRERLLQVADSNAGRMLRLINDLLDIEKMEAGALPVFMEPVTTKTIFDDSIQTISSTADGKQVQIDSSPGEITFTADKDRLVQVVSNLLSNALKFSPTKTTITMAARLDSGFVEISVTDQGRGIPPEMLETIFQRFKQIQKSDSQESHGHGLGLAICQALVELHNGTIEVKSEVGVGSTFLLRLPANLRHDSATSLKVINQNKNVPADS